MTYMKTRSLMLAIGWLILVLRAPSPVAGQDTLQLRRLSLAEALEMAESKSEDVLVAQAAVMRAEGERIRARSQRLPQLYGSAGYTRTLASEFSSVQGDAPADTVGQGGGPADCAFTPRPSDPIEARLDSLEQALRCKLDEDPLEAIGSLFRNLPFGRENQFNLGISGSQTLFSGGRIQAQNRIAEAGLRTASIALTSARAQMALDVAQAYYDAALAAQLLAIAETTLQQSETTLQHTRLAREVGNQAEFDLLRAQVAFETQRPVVIERRTQSDLAMLRLKQILDLPLDSRIALTDVADTERPTLPRFVADLAPASPVDSRASVLQAQEHVRVQESLLDVAESQRWPSVSLHTNYGRVAYPETGFPVWSDFRSNWTVGVTASVPLFLGGRLRGDARVAEANLAEARARLSQVRELAVLDTRGAREQLQAAEAAYAASTGTVGQAQRAYQIAEVRYREGISTQVELTDARILLQQAQANRANAARNLQVAQIRVALLPYLPLGTGSQNVGTQGSTGALAPQGGAQQQQAGGATTAQTGNRF